MLPLPHDDRVLDNRPVAVAVLRRESPTAEGLIPLRVIYCSDEDYSRDLGMISAVVNKLEVAAADPEHPQHEATRVLFDSPVTQIDSRWPIADEFSTRARCHRMDVYLPLAEAPADILNGHPDYDVLFLTVDVPSGRAKVKPMLAADPTQRARDRITKIEGRGGEDTPAAVVIANRKLFEPGDEDLSCLVLISFHRDADGSYLRELARYVGSLRGKRFAGDTDKNYLARLTADERSVRYRRRELPPAMTDGVPVYACDLLIHRPFLRTGAITNRILTVTAERGRRGWIELLPSKFHKDKSYGLPEAMSAD